MKILALVVSMLVLFGSGLAASYFYPGGFALAQAEDQGAGNVVSIVLLAVVMLVGIFASFVFAKAREEQPDTPSTKLSFSGILTDWQFIAAIFVSPLIFNSIYALTQQNPETLSDYLLSFQNGFFWQTVLGGITAKVGKAG